MTHDLRQEAREANETSMGSGNHSWPGVSGALLLRGLEKSLWGAGDKPDLGLVENRDFPGQQEGSPIPAGSHMWLTSGKRGEKGLFIFSCPLQACVSPPQDGREQLQGITESQRLC